MSDSKFEVVEHRKKTLDDPSRGPISSRSLIGARPLAEVVELSLQPLQIIELVTLCVCRDPRR
jgi:hypothetical protein